MIGRQRQGFKQGGGADQAGCEFALPHGRLPGRIGFGYHLALIVGPSKAAGPLFFTFRAAYMASVSTNEMKSGTKVLIDGDPYAVLENEYRKPGKGQATNSLRVRNLKTGRVLEKTLRSGDSWEVADIEETDMQYLYNDGEFWHFMNPASFEQMQAGQSAVEDAAKWIKGEETCRVMLFNGVPLYVNAPNTVELQIVETDPGVRGDTSGGGGKPATLETGAVVRVPLFVQQGELVKVDTRTGDYMGRVGK
tara:strand:- start:3548 stop:4297 length:750 start_codon:yes stop_codon:yes gene_type:complete